MKGWTAMSKFRVKMKLQGFELEIEGSREDASLIGRNIGEQISGILASGNHIIDGEVSSTAGAALTPGNLLDDASKKRGRRRSKTTVTGGERGNTLVIEFRHDPMKFGTPTQDWTTTQKAIWLLYVAKEVAGAAEMSTSQVVKTFNTQFRQAKTVTNSNVSRDLGKAKIASPSLVGEDNTKSPPTWFLTQEGVRRAQELIATTLSSRMAA